MSNYKHLQSKLAKRHKGLFHRVENTACLKHLNRWLISPVIIKCKVKKKKEKQLWKGCILYDSKYVRFWKSIKTIVRLVVDRSLMGQNWWDMEFSRKWGCSVWYSNDGHFWLYIYWSLWNEHKE